MVFLSSGTAYAAEPTFESLIEEARVAYGEENYDVAVDKLLAANRLQPNSRLLLNVARSYGKSGDCAKAIAYYRAYMNAPDAEESLVKTATAEESEISCDTYDESYSGRMMFESTPAGATVTMGEMTLGTTPFETVQIPSGVKTFKFALDGYETVEKDAKIAGERSGTVKVTMTEVVVAEPEPEPEPVATVVVPQKEDTDPMLYVAGGVTGVGVGLLVVGAIYDLSIIPSTDDERAKYSRDSAKWQELTDQRSSEASVALISYASGAVLAIGGGAWLTYLLMTESDTEAPAATAGDVQFFPVVGRDTAGLGVMGHF